MSTVNRMFGFTAVELLVTIAILAILVSIAAPSFYSFTAKQRLRAASFDLRADLMLARSEALKRNRSVTIRAREDAGWQTGWSVVVDESGEELRARKKAGLGVEMDAPGSAITFNGAGRVSLPAGTIRIDMAASDAGVAHCMVLDPSGMPRTYAEACS